MQLKGSAITHITFGKGVVTGLSDSTITVCFSQGEKKFLFPDSFTRFLVLKDEDAQKRVDSVLTERRRTEEREKLAFQEEQERQQRLRDLKISPNSQVVFGLLENTAAEVFSTWSAFTGRYLSGYSKGEPRIPNRLKVNSACLLTQRAADIPEEKREIIGAFMVQDDFDGATCSDGQIQAHETYRLKLSGEQPLLFWDYFAAADRPAGGWGRTEIKYCANTTMQKILYDILRATADTDQHPVASEFYQYYCEVNRLTVLPGSGT